VGDGHERSELRAMLESELAQRGVGMNPLQVEQRIDQLWTSHAERARQGAQGLKMLGKIGLTVANVIRTRELPEIPDMSVPEWLEPPARAVYAVPQSRDPGHQWTAVQLEEDSDEWLQRVHAAVPRLIKSVESATFDAWIDCGPQQRRVVSLRCTSATAASAGSTRTLRPPTARSWMPRHSAKSCRAWARD